MPMQRKSAPVERPWLIMYMTEPVAPIEFSEKSPSMQKPRWLTELYATSFLASRCTQQMRAVPTMPMMQSTAMN
jgi:hypothetical protein